MDELDRDAVADEEDEGSPRAEGGRRPGEVDVEKLADRVYKLMLAEVRLERARGRPAVPHGKR